MALPKDRLNEIIEKLPEEKLELLKRYAEKLLSAEENDEDSFEEAFSYTVKKFDKAFKGLVDR